MSDASFGVRARATTSPIALLALEESEKRGELFEAVDVVLAGVVVRALRGERVLQLTRGDREDALSLVGIPETLREPLRAAFRLEAQQARGAWFLPETVPIKGRALLLPAALRETPRYAHTVAAGEKGKVPLQGNPDAMAVWSALEPFSELLLAPIFLRVEESGLLSKEEYAARWAEVTTTYAELGLELTQELRPFAWRGGWSKLAAEQQVAVKTQLVMAISERLDARTVRAYRAKVTRSLIEQYYSKAKRGRAKRRQVITRQHARGLAAVFGGDWLAFVRYLGEEPHDEERVVTALPEPKVIVTGKANAAELAANQGIPVEEVERILEVFWKDAGGTSPVLERVATLSEYWSHFDQVHERQACGMPSLWGFVEDGGWTQLGDDDHGPYHPGQFRKLLPPALSTKIERLWGTTLLPKWPDSIVSEPFPHTLMAETFGPILAFWHGVALTAWFVCEGPYSRTDIPGLTDYYSRELAALEALGCPVENKLFADLKTVKLGPEEPIYTEHDPIDLGDGLSFGFRTSSGSRRAGFERLRDVITGHRRAWAARHLTSYLRNLWETELRTAARQYHLLSEEKGKPPTLKQFTKHGLAPTRHWFGGDLSLLYTSIGQKFAPTRVRRALRMPHDRIAFANAVFEVLGGTGFKRKVMVSSHEEAQAQATDTDRHHNLRRLALESLTFVQLLEALERPPTLKEFGGKFEWPSKVLSPDADQAWLVFSEAVQSVLDRR